MLDFSKNYFELFGLPVSFTLDTAQLAERYRELQRAVHPDRFASASDQERRLSMQGSVLINEAFETLKDPLLRARYLLTLHGVDMAADNRTTQDAEFLMEQMELREKLDGLRQHSDPYAAISAFMADIGQRIELRVDELVKLFNDPTPTSLNSAQETLRKMQFLQKLQANAESLEAELDEAL